MLSRPPAASEQRPPLQGVDPEIRSSFLKVDTDNSETITAEELLNTLRDGDWHWPYFEIDTVKLLMGIFDINRNGTIEINEYDSLWKYIKTWEGVFSSFDKDDNGRIDHNELEPALKGLGYTLSPQLQDLLERKYDLNSATGETPIGDSPGNASSGITFDRFIRACVVLKQLDESFEALDRDDDDWVKIDEYTFLKMVFKLP